MIKSAAILILTMTFSAQAETMTCFGNAFGKPLNVEFTRGSNGGMKPLDLGPNDEFTVSASLNHANRSSILIRDNTTGGAASTVGTEESAVLYYSNSIAAVNLMCSPK